MVRVGEIITGLWAVRAWQIIFIGSLRRGVPAIGQDVTWLSTAKTDHRGGTFISRVAYSATLKTFNFADRPTVGRIISILARRSFGSRLA